MYQENKDFDVNNLFLNLTFHNSSETFEYRNPLLDHPSNYQLIVTKFLSKVNLPLLYLTETKKHKNTEGDSFEKLTEKTKYYYDAHVRAEYSIVTETDTIFPFQFKKLSLIRNTKDEVKPLARTKLKPLDISYIRDETMDVNNDYKIQDGGEKQNILFWYKDPKYNYVYSPQQVIEMMNNAIWDLFKKVNTDMYLYYKDYDTYFYSYFEKYKEIHPYFFTIENGRIYLKIFAGFAKFVATGTKYTHNDHNDMRYFRFSFPPNLKRFLKGLPGTCDKNGYFYPSVSIDQFPHLKQEMIRFTGIENYRFYVIEGDKISPMEWSDYIGIAVTTSDFPVVGQIFPHFVFNKDSLDNRKRYVLPTDRNIEGFTLLNDDDKLDVEKNVMLEPPKEENVQEQNKANVKENILFVKYFDATDNLYHINYENNNVQTALRMDIVRSMPLQKFTLKLWLIDRFNNLEELRINKYNDEVVMMQLLLQRIKGDEKENRTFIDVVERPAPPPPRMIQEIIPETLEEIDKVHKPRKKKKRVNEEIEDEEDGLSDLY